MCLADNNCSALIYSIIRNKCPETSFVKFNLMSPEELRSTRIKITVDDIKKMYRMKEEGYTCAQIGDVYNRTRQAIRALMKRWECLMKEGEL